MSLVLGRGGEGKGGITITLSSFSFNDEDSFQIKFSSLWMAFDPELKVVIKYMV